MRNRRLQFEANQRFCELLDPGLRFRKLIATVSVRALVSTFFGPESSNSKSTNPFSRAPAT